MGAHNVNGRTVTVLIVDDSSTARMLLTHVLESDPYIRVIGAVADGQAALAFVNHRRPDAILMDLHMPGMDGLQVSRRIMETRPVPIIVCSSPDNATQVATTFRALEAGALTCVAKPPSPDHADYAEVAAHLRQTVKLMSEVKVVRRWARPRHTPGCAAVTHTDGPRAAAAIAVVGIGASTGGPQVLQEVLAALPVTFPVPILIVQHIAHGFLAGLVDWLIQTTRLPVHIGGYGASPLPGHVYLAPDDFHMGLSASGRIVLTKQSPQAHLRPSVSYLFRSLADGYGPAAVGVLLTGMGRDGAEELKLMRDRGAITIAQDGVTAVVNGMPGEAVKLGAATHVLPADRIADELLAIVNRSLADGAQS